MATITTDTFLDSGTARTAGEAWAIDGCTLTVRTDTRWHAGAPAGMTGTLGSITTSKQDLGFIVDGRNVRWMAFGTGSGTVPAIGTTITQGSVSGYLLGVWADYVSAPTAVGASMPATGYLKFREVTGGTFATGTLSGIGAAATSADVVGWIEVVRDTSTSTSGGKFGAGYKVLGNWFSLGLTSGSPNQIIQLPTNNGGSGVTALGVQIETSPGSGVFEWYPAVGPTQWVTTALTTDARAKFVSQEAGGVMRIGSNSAGTAIGYTPPAGCAIRTPNVFLRQALAASRALTNLPSTTGSRAGFEAGYCTFNLDKCSCDWFVSNSNAFSYNLSNSVFADGITAISCNTAISISDVCISNPNAATANALNFSSLKLGGTVNNVTAVSSSASSICSMDSCTGISFSGVKLIWLPANLSSYVNGIAFTGTRSTNITFTNTSLYSCIANLGTCSNISFYNTDYIERMNGPTTSTNGSSQVFFFNTSSEDVLVDGLTWGQNGALSNCHPYANTAIFNCNSSIGGIKVRNVGTAANPLSVGSTSTVFPNAILSLTSIVGTKQSKFQKIFVGNTRSAPITGGTSAANILIEQVGYSTNSGSNPLFTDAFYKAVYASSPFSAVNSLGVMWVDHFVSTTSGRVVLQGSDPRVLYSPYVTTSFANSSSGFGQTSCKMVTNGDFFISETPYFIKGHTGFANVNPTLTQVGGATFTTTYQIDNGSGWNGTYKSLTGANLSAETIDPAVGFKLKIKVMLSGGGNIGYAFVNYIIQTTSTAAAQQANLYPLDTNTLTLTGLIPGSEVRCYIGTVPATAVEIGGTESSGTSFSFTHSSGGQVGYIRIFALGYQPVNYDPYTFPAADTSILVQQVVDRNYSNT